MVKHRITIPKGSKDCDGVECEKNFTFEVDVPENKPTAEKIPEPSVAGMTGAASQVLEPPKQQDKGFTHDELSDIMPKGVNFGRCADGSCHEKIKNKNYTENFKACPGCNSNAVPKDVDYCPTCGKTEPDDDDEYWNDSEIELSDN